GYAKYVCELRLGQIGQCQINRSVPPMEEIEVDPESLEPGDHIYRYGLANTYTHHGIYVGNDTLIHLTKTEPGIRELAMGSSASGKTKEACSKCGYKEDLRRGVVKTCVDCFSSGHKNLYLFEYGISDEEYRIRRAATCHRTQSSPPSEVIKRAIQFLKLEKDFGVYNLFNNNCEQFAVLCKLGTTGLSKQVIAFLQKLGSDAFFLFSILMGISEIRTRIMIICMFIGTTLGASGVIELLLEVMVLESHYDHWSMLTKNFLTSKEYWQVVESGVALLGMQKVEPETRKLKH
ncbi:LRAT domain, partial [Dillenia turbinata]